MLRKFAALTCLMMLASLFTATDSDAGWKNRGWYAKRPGANCTMRTVVTPGYAGKTKAKKVRVCR